MFIYLDYKDFNGHNVTKNMWDKFVVSFYTNDMEVLFFNDQLCDVLNHLHAYTFRS